MDLNIFDKDFQKVAIIDSYTSLMWCKRYYDVGALDLQIEANDTTLSVLKKGYFITRDDDDSVFRIEAIELDTTAEGDDVLIVGAFDCQKILDQRIIWQQVNWNGTVENYIRSLVTNAIISPSISARTISNFILKTAHGFTETVKQQATYDNVGEKIAELCKSYGYGYKITRENGAWCFDVYKGADRSVDQSVNPRVLFSSDFENLISSKYNVDVSDYKNVALVGGEGEGTDRKTRTIGTASGIERHELFVDASGVSSNDGEIDLVDYYEDLIAEGKDKLAEHGTTISFEGEVDAQSYKYKEDYDIGDIVTIRNQYGISVNARITEIIETWDAEGYTIEPKFEYMEIEEEPEPEVQGGLMTENNNLMLTESRAPLLVESAPSTSEGVKISELTEAEELFDGCCFPIVQNGETKKVQKSTLAEQLNQIDDTGASSSTTFSSSKIDLEYAKKTEAVTVALPIGAITASGADLSNDGFLLCNGQAISRTDYAELFAKVGTTFGSGDGSTTFNVPNIEGRVIEGASSGIGNTGGEATHTLTVSEMPSHDHNSIVENYGLAIFSPLTSGTSVGAFYDTTGHKTGTTGGGQPHNNKQPFIKLYYFIKARNVSQQEVQEAIDDTKTTASNVWSAEKVYNELHQYDDSNLVDITNQVSTALGVTSVLAKRAGNTVYLYINGIYTGVQTTGTQLGLVSNLPQKYRPSFNQSVVLLGYNATQFTTHARGDINSSGSLNLQETSWLTNTQIRSGFIYMIN